MSEYLCPERIERLTCEGLPGFDPRRGSDRYVFDVEKALRPLEWIPAHIRHAKGERVGEPFYLLDWQAAFAANLFGWVDAENPRVRRFRECLLYIPKKNGKSAFAAALMAYELFENAPTNSQLFVAASVISQAVKNVWAHFSGQIALDDDLAAELKFYGGDSPNHSKSAVHEKSGAQLLCIAANESTADGDEPYFGIIDELHRFHTAEQVSFCDIMQKGQAALANATIIYTTTAAGPQPNPCNQKWSYASGVRDGVFDDSQFLPAIWEAPLDADPSEVAVWQAANPSLGQTVLVSNLERIFKADKAQGKINHFSRFHLNMRVSTDETWLDVNEWNMLADPLLDIEAETADCVVAVDLASAIDLTALVALFRDDDGYRAYPFFWHPADTVELHGAKNMAPYELWLEQGFLETEPGTHMNYSAVAARLKWLSERFRVTEVVFDPRLANWLKAQASELVTDVFDFTQTSANYNPPVKELETLIANRAISHAGHPILAWNVANAVLKEDDRGLRMPVKPGSQGGGSRGKIDGVIALLMALARWIKRGDAERSVYEERGLFLDDDDDGGRTL